MPFNRLIIAMLFGGAVVCHGADNSVLVPLDQTPAPVQKTIAKQIGDGTLVGIYRSSDDGETTYDVGFTAKSGDQNGFLVAAGGSLLSTEVSLAETPAAVQKTIQAQAAGWQLEGIDKSAEPGDTTYDVEVSHGGVTENFTVDDDGTLESVAMPLEQLPAPVKVALQVQAHGAQILSVDKNMDDTDITYDVKVAAGKGGSKTFTIADDGTLVSTEVSLDETPPAVHAEILKHAAGSTVKSINDDFDPENGDTYDVTAIGANGAASGFTVGAAGQLLSVEVTLDQVPNPVRKTIENQIGNGKILGIDKSLVEKKLGVLPYDVEARKDGKPFDFSVGPKGRFLGLDED